MDPEETKRILPIREVAIDGLAVLKIAKHCNDNFPTLVAGSLLGLDIEDTLEVTYTYPIPSPQSKSDVEGENAVDDMEANEYQFEMLKMLQKVNIDNNCVGWYTSVYFGSSYNMETVQSQFAYQSAEELTENCVVIMFDPIQTRKGTLVMKAFRLSDQFIDMRRKGQNNFIKPSEILVEVPMVIKNSGHVAAFLHYLKDTYKNEFESQFDPLLISGGETFTEKNLDLMGHLIDDLILEQIKFQQYSRNTSILRQNYIRTYNKRVIENEGRIDEGEVPLSLDIKDYGMKPLPDAPPRGESLVTMGQLSLYCNQMLNHTNTTLQKLALTSSLSAAVNPTNYEK